ncbi:hypothetical protein ANME2D_03242 [Candidatus Methanoperedens nitroreducens]|uniref:Uncharacterized protein n=1 Tax=Candidatus Methanoperedens nitratireducens TaxID=1392998 RepID=A0A062V1E3_9EURY|nr:hypothetical protein [Candidatus Methanoperedens nitroreducens]KCZ71207.1 hypothetical protein ANME2D_03242 [Candidatus Methanoperedens nitroreducens]MDJ1421413.1 hypothetical protein [Candidatus Methanoperedens sp.]
MKLSRSSYLRVEAITKITGLILLAVGIDNIPKGNYSIALVFFGLGGMIGIIPLFIEVET